MPSLLEIVLVWIAAVAFFPLRILGWLAFMVFAAIRNGWWGAEIYFTRRIPK